MLSICKITSHPTVDFAAEELKKYLRMMMPDCGNIRICPAGGACGGLRIGLMQDFGLDVSDAEDVDLDDIVYIECTEEGGIIAGDNPRSVLLAVYEFLRQNGCRWLFPGTDGEYIPQQSVKAVQYRHKASCRYRGPCIEGAVSQPILLETVDFLPKVGMNVFMMQFFIPTPFFRRYYNHNCSDHRSPEPVTEQQILAWKTACECELEKRGIQFHDVGHGWTVAPFGIDCSSGWEIVDESTVPAESRRYLAEYGGVRGIFQGRVLNTQFCMSSPEAREKVIRHIAGYAEKHQNVDYLHIWLGDDSNNHCECAACAEKSVSDWYVMLLNGIDEELTRRRLSTRIVFIVYTETTWPPVTERIRNPQRFTLMLAPISRSYTRSLTGRVPQTVPFVRNKITMPEDLDTYMAYFTRWKQVYPGSSFAFEYHFWKHHTFDLSGQKLARRVFEDVEAYHSRGVNGMIACGSQRAYYPNGFACYVFSRKQFDLSLSFEQLAEDYYRCAYGADWREVYDILARLEEAVSFSYLEGEESEDYSISPLYSPARAEKLAAIPAVCEKGRVWLRSNSDYSRRIRSVSVQLLEMHLRFCELYADALYEKALGRDREASRKAGAVKSLLSRMEIGMERYFDLFLWGSYVHHSLTVTGKCKGEIPLP